MDVRVLGPIEVWAGTSQLDIGSRRERGLLALLAISSGEVVTSDRLAVLSAWEHGGASVPILMAHGTADGVCSIEVARAAADEFEANGHPVEPLVFEGGGHSGGMLLLDPGDDTDVPADPDAAEGREVVAAIVGALSAAESAPDEEASGPMETDTITDLEYLSTGSESFLVDVYRPDGDGPFPVIVLSSTPATRRARTPSPRRRGPRRWPRPACSCSPDLEHRVHRPDEWRLVPEHRSRVVRTGLRRGACARPRRRRGCDRDLRHICGCPSGRLAGAGPRYPRRGVCRRCRSDRPGRRGPDRQRVPPALDLLPTDVRP